ncbi:ABC transporter permease, partial [Lacticaseibacillus chiayiensis]|uniref:ABC transporter permease n=1 Tax=Lacticaseibacillus chiayiensis TaxID=2100821 RepID=UPI001011696C
IGVFVIVFGYEFTQKVYKNTLISGISRLQFILAKYLVMLLDLLILFTTHFAMVLIGGLIKGRALGGDWTTVFETMGLSIVAATFFLSVVFSLGVFLLIATGSMTIATIVVVIFPLLIEVLNVIAQWKWLKYFDFFGVSQNIGVGSMKMNALPPYIAVSFGFLIVMIGMSVLILRRKEL